MRQLWYLTRLLPSKAPSVDLDGLQPLFLGLISLIHVVRLSLRMATVLENLRHLVRTIGVIHEDFAGLLVIFLLQVDLVERVEVVHSLSLLVIVHHSALLARVKFC